jgi:hypothetical protein
MPTVYTGIYTVYNGYIRYTMDIYGIQWIYTVYKGYILYIECIPRVLEGYLCNGGVRGHPVKKRELP